MQSAFTSQSLSEGSEHSFNSVICIIIKIVKSEIEGIHEALTLTDPSTETMIAIQTNTAKTSKDVITRSCLIVTVIHVQYTFINI